MGRYYSGDIEGKFWFGVQSSDDASFFGGSQTEPSHIDYYFGKNDLDQIKDGIEACLKTLGENKQKLDDFFKANNGYNDAMLAKEGLNPDLLEWYARLELGQEILKCVEENGHCAFQAEL